MMQVLRLHALIIIRSTGMNKSFNYTVNKLLEVWNKYAQPDLQYRTNGLDTWSLCQRLSNPTKDKPYQELYMFSNMTKDGRIIRIFIPNDGEVNVEFYAGLPT